MTRFMEFLSRGKLLIIFFLAFVSFFGIFYTANAGEDYVPWGFLQCSRHGFHDDAYCGPYRDVIGNEYTSVKVAWKALGHRHGSSEIFTTVCLVENYNGEAICQFSNCRGDRCGEEYGDFHPFDEPYATKVGDDSFSVYGFESYTLLRSAYVEDAEVRLHIWTWAYYPDPPSPIYGCTDPTAANYNPSANTDDDSCKYYVNLNFYVKNQYNQSVSGALITLNQDFGNGATRTTDGSGFANFGVYNNTTISYSISANSCNGTNGSIWSDGGATVNVTINCTGIGRYKCVNVGQCSWVEGDIGANQCTQNSQCCAANYNQSCSVTSLPNACGQTQTSYGTIPCSGIGCSVSTPPPPPNTCIPVPSITCNPGTVGYGGSSTISWLCTNSSSGSVSPTSWTGLSGSQSTGALYSNQGYTLTCVGYNGTNPTASCSVTVSGPSVDIKANGSDGPITIPWNTSATISWTSSNASSCSVSPTGWTGLSGSQSTGNITTPGTYVYTANCSGNGSASDSATVIVSAPIPNTPSAPTITLPDYCYSGPAVTVSWVYSDPSGSPQSAYQVQITNTGSFVNPIFDSGKIQSGSSSYFTGQGILQFNTTYRARVRVWNGFDSVSGWSNPSDSWKTPSYAYPQVNFTWTANTIIENPSPPLDKPVQFTDQTVFQGNPNGRIWAWTFGDGGSSAQQNPAKTYSAEGTYYVTLTATDNANQTCSKTRGPLIIQKPIPRWREVAPK